MLFKFHEDEFDKVIGQNVFLIRQFKKIII